VDPAGTSWAAPGAGLWQAPGARVDVLVAPVPLGWLSALDRPSFGISWCPRREALTRRRPLDQVRSLAADKLLSVLCRRWGVPAHRYEPTGQPSCGPDAHLTASHDGDYVVAGIAQRALGVDVVDCRRATGLVARLMSDEERAADLGRAAAGQVSAAGRGRAWAVREAALKWAGVGMALDPRALTVVCGAGHLDGRRVRASAGGTNGQARPTVPPARADPSSRPDPVCVVGQTWWTVWFPDGRVVSVVAGTLGADHALALAVEPPVTVRLHDHLLDDDMSPSPPG